MLFGKKKKKNELQADVQKPGKDQPDIFLGTYNEKDLIAPSLIKEVGPGDQTVTGRADDYFVEVGATAEAIRYFRSFFATMTGGTTYYGMLNQLYNMDFGEADCDVALHVTPLDQARTIWQLEQRIAQLEVEFADEANSARRRDLSRQINELTERHTNIRTGNERLFMMSIQATASSTNMDNFRRFCNMLVKRFAGKGVHLRTADTRQLEALIQMTPLDENPIKDTFRAMESSNIADLFPYGNGGISHKTGIPIGLDSQGNLIFYDPWHATNENYNIVILGRAGSGKSFTTKLIFSRLMLLNIRVGIIDPEIEYLNALTALGCPYVQLNINSRDRINIFDLDEEEDTDGNISVNLDQTIKAVEAIAFRMVRIYQPDALTGQAKVKLQEKIKELYDQRGITTEPASLYEVDGKDDDINLGKAKKRMPTLGELWQNINGEPELTVVAQLLKPFTRYGGVPSQAVFDCESNVNLKNAPAFGISVAGLDEEIMKPLGLFVATKWVWEKFGENRNMKKMIIVDEAQLMMDTPETATWLENAFRRARKRNTSMTAITQGFEVFIRVPQGLGILKNASSKFLLKQEAIDIASVQEKFSLSEGEAMFLLNARKGYGIIKVNNEASVFFADSTPDEYRMFTSDPNDLVNAETA